MCRNELERKCPLNFGHRPLDVIYEELETPSLILENEKICANR
jgi:hypothetical protein